MDTMFLNGNDIIENAINMYYEDMSKENAVKVFEAIRIRANQDGHFLIPVEPPEKDENEDTKYKMRLIEVSEGEMWLVAFTSMEEMDKGEKSYIISHFIDSVLESALNLEGVSGLIINPWGKSFMLDKEALQVIQNVNNEKKSVHQMFCDMCDITRVDCDCIVNAANKSLLGGGGVDGAIHRAAGKELLKECRSLNGCETGEAKITKGYNLKANYIIHTVGPIYSGSEQDKIDLENCYKNSLNLAREYGINSIAFPSISTGVYGYPLEEAVPIAINTILNWLKENNDYGMEVLCTCFDEKTYEVYQKYMDDIRKAGKING